MGIFGNIFNGDVGKQMSQEAIRQNDIKKYQEIGLKITRAMKSFGSVKDTHVSKVHVGPSFITCELTVALGVRINQIEALVKDIEVQVNSSVRFITDFAGRKVACFEVSRDERMVFGFERINIHRACQGMDLPIIFGLDAACNPVAMDLAKMPHMTISGETGGGKSNLIHSILCGLLIMQPDKFVLKYLDFKGLDSFFYGNLRQLNGGLLTEYNSSLNEVKSIAEEMKKRNELLKKHSCQNLKQFNDLLPSANKLKSIVFVFDEFASAMADEKIAMKEDKSHIGISHYCNEIARQGRAAGVHMIIATQRPDADVMPSQLRANVPFKVALRVRNGVNSSVALDSLGAEKLLGAGDMLINVGGGDLIRCQSPLMTPEFIETICKNNRKYV